MTFRVTILENGVQQDYIDFTNNPKDLLRIIGRTESEEYVEQVRKWIDEGYHSPLVIKESSVYSDLWEYVP